MNKIINIYKPISLTPLQVVEKFKEQFPEYAESKISYAGRLDPLAEGVLILLIDEENKNREKYQRLDKEYEFEVLFGVATDTYDLLGIVKNPSLPNRHSELNSESTTQISKSKIQMSNKIQSPKLKRFGFLIRDFVRILGLGFRFLGGRKILKQVQNDKTRWLEKEIKEFTTKLIGRREQPYPPFSSFQIQKKPLFQWAKEGRLDEIEIPTKEIEIYSTKHLGTYEIEPEELHRLIIERVGKVQGKFRQREILKRWEMFFEKSRQGFPIMKFRTHCGSGTYVRSIANEMGKIAGTGALTLSIKRTRVGEYKIANSITLLP